MRTALLTALLLLGACTGKPADPPAATTAAVPDWSGVWLSGGIEMNVDGFTPADPAAMAGPPSPAFIFSPVTPWNEAGKAKVQAIMAATHGDPGNNAANAAGWGYPLMMVGPAALQFLHTTGLTVIMNLYRDTRQIYTDGRGHQPAEEGWPTTTWGDSIGHWEGDTLVIDTVGVRDPGLYFQIAAPFSEKAHYVERLRLTAPDRIEGEMTIEDSELLAAPVKIPLLYVRSKEIERMVFDSFSNDRSGFDGEFNTIESKAK
ncbi:MAG: hypothetical protein ABI859_17940 [Pseudomonadota bacterium]